ncbi:hypothetical protein ABJ99_2834 [Pseudomonas syringae pv. cilantro]|uniref:Uncharacterized protein n=2 Tax=Pseudomonas syringae group TaxID=136849 RepID=A0A0N0XA28_PSESX|nr:MULTISPECIES: hypothetical protein [Pseudomonas syringae group]KPC31464.1 hypothetical protein ABJ99_2834 [Pseudomonas syringae pv. cilantro]KPW79924.1 hypothetical protein ALO76_03535 [Pseudomonas syringae pv. coriandricola]RMN13358.1 hypothetical protein ALQ65_02517 [Pseudomonas syringae pv. coriandricola]
MTGKNKNWIVRDDRTSSVNTLTVAGLVPTTSSNAIPMLAVSNTRGGTGLLALNLTYKTEGAGLTVMGEAQVVYTQPSDPTITTVCIYKDGELVVSIDDITVIR